MVEKLGHSWVEVEVELQVYCKFNNEWNKYLFHITATDDGLHTSDSRRNQQQRKDE